MVHTLDCNSSPAWLSPADLLRLARKLAEDFKGTSIRCWLLSRTPNGVRGATGGGIGTQEGLEQGADPESCSVHALNADVPLHHLQATLQRVIPGHLLVLLPHLLLLWHMCVHFWPLQKSLGCTGCPNSLKHPRTGCKHVF